MHSFKTSILKKWWPSFLTPKNSYIYLKEISLSVLKTTKDHNDQLSLSILKRTSSDDKFAISIKEEVLNLWMPLFPFSSPRPAVPNNRAHTHTYLSSQWCILERKPKIKREVCHLPAENLWQHLHWQKERNADICQYWKHLELIISENQNKSESRLFPWVLICFRKHHVALTESKLQISGG